MLGCFLLDRWRLRAIHLDFAGHDRIGGSGSAVCGCRGRRGSTWRIPDRETTGGGSGQVDARIGSNGGRWFVCSVEYRVPSNVGLAGHYAAASQERHDGLWRAMRVSEHSSPLESRNDRSSSPELHKIRPGRLLRWVLGVEVSRFRRFDVSGLKRRKGCSKNGWTCRLRTSWIDWPWADLWNGKLRLDLVKE